MRLLFSTGGIASTNCYLVADEASKQAVLFDAPDNTVSPLLDEAKSRGYDVIGLWLTHAHYDHIADHARVTAAFPNAKVLLHPADAMMLRKADMQSRMFMLPIVIPGREPDLFIEDGQTLELGSLKVKVIHTPGHAPGHVMYHFPHEKVLVGGDLIICGAVGRTDLPGSDENQLIRSIQKVYQIVPPDTRLLPGHCEESTLAAELEMNPYVRAIVASGKLA